VVGKQGHRAHNGIGSAPRYPLNQIIAQEKYHARNVITAKSESFRRTVSCRTGAN